MVWTKYFCHIWNCFFPSDKKYFSVFFLIVDDFYLLCSQTVFCIIGEANQVIKIFIQSFFYDTQNSLKNSQNWSIQEKIFLFLSVLHRRGIIIKHSEMKKSIELEFSMKYILIILHICVFRWDFTCFGKYVLTRKKLCKVDRDFTL